MSELFEDLEQTIGYQSQDILRKIKALEIMLDGNQLDQTSRVIMTDSIKNLREQEAELWITQSRIETARKMNLNMFNSRVSGDKKDVDETIRTRIHSLKTDDKYVKATYENVYSDMERDVTDFLTETASLDVIDVEAVNRVQSAFKTILIELSDPNVKAADKNVVIDEFKTWVNQILKDPSTESIKEKILATLEKFRLEAASPSIFKRGKRGVKSLGNSLMRGVGNAASESGKNILRTLADNPVFNMLGVTGAAYGYIDKLSLSRKGSISREGSSNIRESLRNRGDAASPTLPRSESQESEPVKIPNPISTPVASKLPLIQNSNTYNGADSKILSEILKEIRKGNNTQSEYVKSNKAKEYVKSKERNSTVVERNKDENKKEEGSLLETLKNIAMIIAAIPAAIAVLGARFGGILSKIPLLGKIFKTPEFPSTGGFGNGATTGKNIPCIPVCKGMGIPEKNQKENRRGRRELPNKTGTDVDFKTSKPTSQNPTIEKNTNSPVEASKTPSKTGFIKGGLLGLAGIGAEYAGNKLEESGHEKIGAVTKTAGTAAEYAGMGAMAGSFIPGLGTLVGGAIGGAIGTGIGLYENGSKIFSSEEKPNAFKTTDVSRSEAKQLSQQPQITKADTIEDLLKKQIMLQKIQNGYLKESSEEEENKDSKEKLDPEESERIEQVIANAEALVEKEDNKEEKTSWWGNLYNALMGSNKSLPSSGSNSTGSSGYSGGGSGNVGEKYKIARDPNAKAGAGKTENAMKAMKYFQENGYTEAQAAGMVGNLQMESGKDLNVKSLGDGGKAYGIAQWHPDRQANFKKVYGKDIQGSTLEEQLAFMVWELKNTEKKAGEKIKGATTAKEAAILTDATYERSSGEHTGHRIDNAEALVSSGSTTVASNKPVVEQASKNANIKHYETWSKANPSQKKQIENELNGIPQPDGSLLPRPNVSTVTTQNVNTNVSPNISQNNVASVAQTGVNVNSVTSSSNVVTAQPISVTNPIIGTNSNVSLSDETIQKIGQVIAANSKASSTVIASNQSSSGNKNSVGPVQSTKSPVNISNIPI